MLLGKVGCQVLLESLSLRRLQSLIGSLENFIDILSRIALHSPVKGIPWTFTTLSSPRVEMPCLSTISSLRRKFPIIHKPYYRKEIPRILSYCSYHGDRSW